MAKHFLYLTNDKLIALVWSGGAIVERDVFGAGDAETPGFAEYLERHRDLPTYVVTDLIEEDFRIDTVPHLRGGDQEAVLGRKLAQLYRASNYRHAIVQERETEGRRDDRVLYHAITNPDLLKPWLAALEKAAVPLEAVSASAVLSARLPRELNVFFTHTLLVTIVPDFGLRQTYFQNRQIKFSRLTPILYDEGQSVGTLVAAETGRTWQYLDSLRYFAGGDTLEACIMVHARDRETIAEAIRTYPLLKYRFLDIDEVAAKVKLKPAPVSSHAEEVLVHLYAQGRIENHFAEREQTRFARFRRTRIGLYGLTAGLLLAGVIGAAFNLYQASVITAAIDKREIDIRALQSSYQSIAKSLSGQSAATETVRDASAFFRAQMRPSPPAPGPFLRDVAGVLNAFPKLNLLQAVWVPSQDGTVTPKYQPTALKGATSITSTVRAPAGVAAAPTPAQPIGDPPLPGAKNEVLLLEASLDGIGGNYRAALAEIERLATSLRALPGVQVEAIDLPIDVRPTASIKSVPATAGADSEARFVLRVSRQRSGA